MVRTGPVEVDDRALQGCVLRDGLETGPGAFLEVEDEGCGIARRDLARVLEPFFTTRAMGKGMGLAAVAGIVRWHGGAMGIDADVGKGTRFRIFLPRSEPPVH